MDWQHFEDIFFSLGVTHFHSAYVMAYGGLHLFCHSFNYSDLGDTPRSFQIGDALVLGTILYLRKGVFGLFLTMYLPL